jgi:predicted peptidase
MSKTLLAWVAILGLTAVLARAADEKPTTGKLVEKKLDKGDDERAKLAYLLYLPDGYEKQKSWPLVLFLHGKGDRISRLKRFGLPRQVEREKRPFILVAPQNPSSGFWNVRALGGLLDDVTTKHKVDKDRVYVTGLSMGGFGTWALAAAYPDRFAAIIPICGGGNPRSASKIKDLPIWAFHGAKDTIVRPERTEVMVKALKAAGAKNVQLTIYPDAQHDSWTRTYRNPKVWTWLLEQKRAPGKKE